MLKVLPIQTKEQQKEICEACSVCFNADLLAYAAYDDDALMGVCQFRLTANGGEIHDLAPANGTNSFESLFIMGRGTLNFIDLCGVHYARYIGKGCEERTLKAIGFKQEEDGTYAINLEGFFTDHCGNHK